MNAKMLVTFALGGGLILSCCAQGTFQNLDFESATVGPDPSRRTVSFASAFPGWAGYINGQQSSTVLYNDINLSQAAFALMGPGGNRIDGNYTAIIEASSLSQLTVSYLSQTGLVPSDSLSLRFFSTSPDTGFAVSLNGTTLNLVRLQDIGTSFPFYSLYAADVSGFAGQAAELRIINSVPAGRFNTLWVDSFVFSPTPVPEPSIWALLALGSALFWCAARRRRKKVESAHT